MTRPTPERIEDIRRMARFGVRVVPAQRRDLLAEIDALRAELAEATKLITGEDTEERLAHLCKFGEAAKVEPPVRLCEKCGAEAGSSGSVSIDIWKRDRVLLAEARAELVKLRESADA